MIAKLPVLQSVYDQSFNVQISDQTYTFRFRYNQTEKDSNDNGAWYCYLGLLGEDPKVKFKLVVGMDLLAPWRGYEEIPFGVLYVYDKDLTYGRPGKNNFYTDGRFPVIYADLV